MSENQGVCGKWRSIFRRKNTKWLFYLLIPASILIGIKVFQDRAYIWISLWIALLSAVPFFLAFERRKANTKRMLLLSVLTALSVLGRFVFAPLPHFKPVTAMVVLTGMYVGAESGFLCGALTAILSNILFGQGPWTPFSDDDLGNHRAAFGSVFPLVAKKPLVSCRVWCLGGSSVFVNYGCVDGAGL